jgi:hypothetical protein
MRTDQEHLSFQEDLAWLMASATSPRATEKDRSAVLLHCGVKPWGTVPSSTNAFVYSSSSETLLGREELWTSTLAKLCDLYAKIPMHAVSSKQVHLVVVMLELAKSGRWRQCLAAPRSPHALVRNLLTARRIVRKSPGYHDIFTEVFNEWSAFDGAKLPLLDVSKFVTLEDAGQERAIISSLFGAHVWLLRGPSAGEAFDIDMIVRDAPAFTTGLLPYCNDREVPLPILEKSYGA